MPSREQSAARAKEQALREINHLVQGGTSKTSKVLTEFERCNDQQQAAKAVGQALHTLAYGRWRTTTRLPAPAESVYPPI